MDVIKVARDTEAVCLSAILELLETNPAQAKQIIKKRYEEIMGSINEKN